MFSWKLEQTTPTDKTYGIYDICNKPGVYSVDEYNGNYLVVYNSGNDKHSCKHSCIRLYSDGKVEFMHSTILLEGIRYKKTDLSPCIILK